MYRYESPGAVSPPPPDGQSEPTMTDCDIQKTPGELEFEEPAMPGSRRERRGDNLWRSLGERHINMIAFSGTIGNGLFLGSGSSIAAVGPGGTVLCYVLMGTIISSVISCVGEMTALMPVNAPMMEFPRRFLDRGVGLAVGWMYWFAYAVLAADELVAVSNAIKFRYDDGKTFLNWPVGENVDNAVWISVFLVLVVIVNLFPVRVFGELEYIFGSIKLTFITFLIVLMLILDNINPRENAYYNEPLGTKYWNYPYSFFTNTFAVKDNNGNVQRLITGSLGTFLAIWTTFISVFFSYIGMDIVAATAAESKSLADVESMKMAARKINIRIITLYTLAVLTVSFVVPMDHPFLNGAAQSVGARSAFVIAVVEAGLPRIAHFFNAVFVFSAFTCAINSMYIASRVLHTLALRGQTGPDFITKRLRHCRSGVPIRAIFATAFLTMLGYMGRSGSPGERLSELANNATVSCLVVYVTICATYVVFYKRLKEAKLYGNTSESQASTYDRDHELYPYKSHGQWLKAGYGLVLCALLLVFNGVLAFLTDPFDARRFISAYISIPVFLLLILGYKVRKHRFRLNEYGAEKSNDLSGAVQAISINRKGRLEFTDDGFTGENIRIFIVWVWTWMK